MDPVIGWWAALCLALLVVSVIFVVVTEDDKEP
jgi:hypothetical protein